MALCAACGGPTDGSLTMALCRHHIVGDVDWATWNRQACDGLHRRRWPMVAPDPEGARGLLERADVA